MPIIEEDIPGLEEAIQKESLGRLGAYLDVERIGNIDVLPLTPRMALELEAAGSPFLVGGTPTPGDIAAFLWHVSVHRVRKPWWRTAQSWKDSFCRQIANQDTFFLAGRIAEYMQATSYDSPGSGDGGDSVPFASWVSAIVDAVACRYGWSEDEILDTPFRRIWQYCRRWTWRESGGKKVFINPLVCKARAEWLQQKQQELDAKGTNDGRADQDKAGA